MYQQHFGLTGSPLDKGAPSLFDNEQLATLATRFQWLLDSPGIGVLTGEAGVGKTAALHQLCKSVNPHRHKVIYSQDNDCSRRDLYRNFAIELGLEPAYRRTQLWRDIKSLLEDLHENKQLQVVWIIDESQNLPAAFFRDFPAFLNFAFDSKDMMTVWLVGLPQLLYTLDRAPYAALRSRIQVRAALQAFQQPAAFQSLVKHAFKAVGSTDGLMSDSGIELLRQASQGKPRQAGLIIKAALRLAAGKGMNHLPDDIIEEAMEVLR